MRPDPGILLASLVLVALGVAIIRVGLIGQYLGGLRLVSFVKKYPENPRLHHRIITTGIGMVSVLLGLGFGILAFCISRNSN